MDVSLVEACLKEARSLGLRKVFALTYAEGFFLRIGFRVVEKSTLPHKVWGDCLKCPKFPECDETAMVLEL
jgi:amino-acid N-acetyltransferase